MKSYFLSGKGKGIFTFLALIFLVFCQGCTQYYNVQTVNKVTPQQIKEYYSLNKYLILRQGNKAWHLSDIIFDDQGLSGNLTGLPDNRKYYLFKSDNRTLGIRYKHRDKNNVLDQVHLYVRDSIVPEIVVPSHTRLSFSDIHKVKVFKKDGVTSTLAWLAPPIFGIGVLVSIAFSVTGSF